VEELVPDILPLGSVQKVLQNLVKENVSIRDLLTIVEAMADYGSAVKDPDQLTEYVRGRLSRTIIKPYLGGDGTLSMITLHQSLERVFQENLRQTDHGAYLAMDPMQAQRIIKAINKTHENAVASDGQPVLLTSPSIRPHLAQLITRFIPNLPVISQAEIPSEIRLQTLAVVNVDNAS
jgi:flagellar biosynthesis protein FlhA